MLHIQKVSTIRSKLNKLSFESKYIYCEGGRLNLGIDDVGYNGCSLSIVLFNENRLLIRTQTFIFRLHFQFHNSRLSDTANKIKRVSSNFCDNGPQTLGGNLV